MLYKAGEEVRFLKFDATGMDNTNWFSQTQLNRSSWTDLKTFGSVSGRFDIRGHSEVSRSFEISTYYGGCQEDGGWLVITSTSSESKCKWARRNNVSSIVYSAKTTSAKFNNYGKIRHFL